MSHERAQTGDLNASPRQTLKGCRWLQYSLRSLLALLLLACIGVGLLSNRMRRERQLVAELESSNVSISISELSPAGKMLRDLLGDVLCGATYSAHMKGEPTNEQLLKLKQLASLQSVTIDYDAHLSDYEIDALMDRMQQGLPHASISLHSVNRVSYRGFTDCSFGCFF